MCFYLSGRQPELLQRKSSSLCRAWEAYFKIFERGRTFNDEYFYVRMYLNRFGVP